MLHSLRSLKLFLLSIHIEVTNKIMSQLPTSPSFPQTFDVTFFFLSWISKEITLWQFLLFAYDENTFGLWWCCCCCREGIDLEKWVVLHLPTHTKISLYLKEYLCIEKQILRSCSFQKKKIGESERRKGKEYKRENQYGWKHL